jgi:hypothetical protein
MSLTFMKMINYKIGYRNFISETRANPGRVLPVDYPIARIQPPRRATDQNGRVAKSGYRPAIPILFVLEAV